MNIKSFIKNLFAPDAKTLSRRKKRKEHKSMQHISYDMPEFYSSDFNDKFDMDLYAVAFNNAKLIDYQIKFLKKYIKSKFIYIVVDNSKIKEESEKIRAICKRENITYLKIFNAKKIKGYSASHAMAMNWAVENLIEKRKSNFAFIDHDIYPTQDLDVFEYIKDRPFFGRKRSSYKANDGIYYLWAGLAFFNWSAVADKKLDFGRLPNIFGRSIADTGASNWKSIYKYYDESLLPTMSLERYNIYKNTFDTKNEIDFRRTCVEYLNNRQWVHLVAASAWCEIGDKNDFAFKFLDNLLEGKTN